MRDKLITIATFDNPPLAHILQAKLESEGIDSYIIDENVATLFWHLNAATRGVKLQVKQSDAARTQQIIADKHRAQSFAVSLNPETRCPKCNSDNIYFQKLSRAWAMLGFLLFRFPIPVPKRKWICSDCSHQWKQRPMPQSQGNPAPNL